MDFEKELSSNWQFVRTVAMKLTQDSADADDLTQDVMVAALRFRHKYEEGTNMRGWLSTICRNTFVNNYRKKARSKEVLTEDLKQAEAGADDVHDFDIGFSEEPLRNELISAVMELPAKYMNIFILVHLYEFTYADVAEIKDMPIGTIKSILFKSRVLLREVLKGRAEDMGIRYRHGE